MNDLISRSALCEKLQAHHDFFVNAWGGFGNLPPKDKARVDEITHCIAEAMNAPAVDAVVPVRCNDCDHCLINLKWNTALCMRDVCRVRVPLDGFCNFGVPRGAK